MCSLFFFRLSIIILHFSKISSSYVLVINGFPKLIYKRRVRYNASGTFLMCSIIVGSFSNRFSNPLRLCVHKKNIISKKLLKYISYEVGTYQQIDALSKRLQMHVWCWKFDKLEWFFSRSQISHFWFPVLKKCIFTCQGSQSN